MAAWVEVVVVARQVLHQRQVLRHHAPRQLPDALILGTGVHNIRRVGHDGAKPVFLQQRPQLLQVVGLDGLGPGPPRIADKALEGVGVHGQRRLSHLVKSSGRG